MSDQEIKQNKIRGLNILPLNLVILFIVFLILIQYCSLQPIWLVAFLLLDYFVLLIINLLAPLKKVSLNWLFILFLILMPLVVLFYRDSWQWWMWLLIIFSGLASLGGYFLTIFKKNYRYANLPLLIYLLLMLWFMTFC